MKPGYTFNHDGMEYEVVIDEHGNSFTRPRGSTMPMPDAAKPMPHIDWIMEDNKSKTINPKTGKSSIYWDKVLTRHEALDTVIPNIGKSSVGIDRAINMDRAIIEPYTAPLKSLKDKFVIKSKDGKHFFNEFKKKSLSYDAITFDTVTEALNFADNISEETIVDKI